MITGFAISTNTDWWDKEFVVKNEKPVIIYDKEEWKKWVSAGLIERTGREKFVRVKSINPLRKRCRGTKEN
jgi:hypothetical protein